MAVIPYMPLYISDYLADAAHLTTLEHGAYMLLLMTYWQSGKPLRALNERLANVARMSNEDWLTVRPAIAEFFDEVDGFWVHKRVEAELSKFREKSEKSRAAGLASAQRRFNGRSTDVQRTFNHTDTDTYTEKDLKTLAQSDESLHASKPEVLSSPQSLQPAGTIPLVDGSQFAFTQADVSAWTEAYPAVDVLQQLREMREWSRANPKNRKTKAGIRRFITQWLAKEQDKPARNAGGSYGTRESRTIDAARAAAERFLHRAGPDADGDSQGGGGFGGDVHRLCAGPDGLQPG